MEVHSTFVGDIIIQATDKECVVYTETNREFTNDVYDIIESRFPEAMKALDRLYKKSKPNLPHFRYKIVSRFLRCNLGGYDNKLDFESDGTVNLELVSCPLRGECEHENIICRPKAHNPMSQREFEVMRYIYSGYGILHIANELNISEHTCKTHKQNAMKKLDCHSIQDFMRYAEVNNIFEP